MTLRDWVKNSKRKITTDGLLGIYDSLVELWYGIRERTRRLHWLTPNTRTLSIEGTSVKIRQEHIGEFDHIRAHHNESWLANELVSELGCDDCFWDVGGNIGIYTLIAAKQGSKVVAFEPWLENAATIEKNLQLNDVSARIIPKALSAESGPNEFILDKRQSPGSGRGSLPDNWQDGETRIVECVRGDKEQQSNDLPTPSVIKIDVEGAELDVLRGLEEILDTVRVIYCELHGIHDDEVREFLQTNQFKIDADVDETGCGIIRARSK